MFAECRHHYLHYEYYYHYYSCVAPQKDVAPASALVQALCCLADVEVQGHPPSKDLRERNTVPLQRSNRLGCRGTQSQIHKTKQETLRTKR
jgi:hypothetical protein